MPEAVRKRPRGHAGSNGVAVWTGRLNRSGFSKGMRCPRFGEGRPAVTVGGFQSGSRRWRYWVCCTGASKRGVAPIRACRSELAEDA